MLAPAGAELECPLNHIRLVHQDEVASSFAERSPVQFSNVISPLLQFSEGFFHSFDIPNTGQLVFDDDFVLVGLTSQGYEVSYLYFVSNFTFQYSNVADSSDFTTYPIVSIRYHTVYHLHYKFISLSIECDCKLNQ